MTPTTAQEVKPVLVSKKEACQVLGGICVRTLEHLINDKELPVRRIRGRVFIPYSALVKYAAAK